MPKNDSLKKVLRRHGIEDADEYLESRGDKATVARSTDPDVYMRGSVHLMMRRTITRDEVRKGLAALKHV